MSIFLSYIIPVYNCEKYVIRCLDSLSKQGLAESEYEIIVINDGSTDRSEDLIKDYTKNKSNFRLFSRSNHGVGESRNFGVEKANGQYVMFVDADDWLLEKGISELKKYMIPASPKDIYSFWLHTVDKKYDKDKWDNIGDHNLIFSGSFKNYVETYGFGWCSCSRIISREYLISNNIRFTSHKVGEDLLFMAKLFSVPNGTIVATSLNIYRYYVHIDSAVNSIDIEHNYNVCLGYMDIFNELLNMSNNHTYYKKAFQRSIYDCQLKTFTRMLSGAKDYKALKFLRQTALKNKIFPISGNNGTLRGIANWFIARFLPLYILSQVYIYIFLPFIKPYIGRN